MKFPGREKQLQIIQNLYQKQGSSLVILYGDQGLGKTTLLLNLRKTTEALYYQAVPGSERQQAAFMYRALCSESTLPADTVCSYADIFAGIARKKQAKLLLVIDDFEHLLRAGEEFAESLQIFLNHGYADTDFLVILCTSSLGFVRSSMAKKLGRAAFQIQGLLKMNELSFSDVRLLCRNEAITDTFQRFALFGGNLSAILESQHYKSVMDMICRMYLDQRSAYYDYGLRYISENLRELNVYATILYVIASGRQKLNELYRYTGFSRAKISVYLKNLMELDIVQKVYSYGAGPRDDSQKGIYRIINPMIYFWYHFIYDKKNELEMTDPIMFYTNYIEKDLDAFYEKAYVRMLRQLLCEHRLNCVGNMERCEEWVGKSGDIPILAFDDQNRMVPVFCRLTGKPVKKTDLEWYEFCMKKAGIHGQDYIVFTEAGVHNEIQPKELKHQLIASAFANYIN